MRKRGAIRVVIAEDHELVRAGFQRILSSPEDVEVVFESEDGCALVSWVQAGGEADVAVVDLEMPKLNGIDTTRHLAGEIPVLLVSGTETREVWLEAIQAGARGVMSKTSPADQLVTAVRAVASGGLYADGVAAKEVVGALAPRPIRSDLTARECAVLELMVKGLSNKEISDRLGCAQGTVRIHAGKIFGKLGVKSREDAVLAIHRAKAKR